VAAAPADSLPCSGSISTAGVPFFGSVPGITERGSRICARGDLGSFDAIYVQYEVFPYIPGMAGVRLLAPAGNVVLDYDDAAFVPYDGRPFLRAKISLPDAPGAHA